MPLELRSRFCWRAITIAHLMTEYCGAVLMQPVGNLSSGTCQKSACCGEGESCSQRTAGFCAPQEPDPGEAASAAVSKGPLLAAKLPGESTGAREELLVTGCCWLPCPARTQEWKSLVPEKVMQKETAKQTHRNQEGNLFSSCNIFSALSPEKASMPSGKEKISQICSMITEQAERTNFKLRGNKLITSAPKVKREIIRKI